MSFAPIFTRRVLLTLGAFLLPVVFAHAQANLPRARVGVNYTFQVSTTPAAPAGTVYSATGLPTGLSINGSSGLIAGTPTTAGTSTGTISLLAGGITNSFAFTLAVDPAAGTPTIMSATTATATVGQAFTYTVTADNAPTSFNVGALPAGLSFATPVISGTPSSAGTFNISLSANNASGTGATKTLVLTVSPAGPVPAITSATTATASLNVAFTYTVTASNTPTSYAAVGLPLGLSLNATTGVISGTPTVAGLYSVTLSAANANGSGATTTLTLTVGSVSTISSAATASLTLNQAGTFQLAATNTPLSYNVTGLPPGLSVNSTGLISGTPTSTGTFTINVSANNATGTGPSSTLTITIAAAPGGGGGAPGGGGGGGSTPPTAPVFTTHPTSRSVTEGTSVTFTAAAAGTAPITYQWRRNGTPIAGATSATLTLVATLSDSGSYTLAATNAASTTVSDAAALTVSAVLVAPTITTGPGSQAAVAGGSVSFSVAASGTAPFTFQWLKGGVAISGATGSTLTLGNVALSDAGNYAVVVTNSAGSATSSAATLTVSPNPAAHPRVINLSSRSVVGTGEKVLIAGFYVTGDSPKQLLIRGVGPGLAPYGISSSEAVSDPLLELFDSTNKSLTSNDNWSSGSNAATIAATAKRVGAFDLTENSKDAVILTTLNPGLYSAVLKGAANATGIGLVEIYDAGETPSMTRLFNVSSRGQVGTGGSVMIAGVVVTGQQPKKLLIRAVGPTLSGFGVEQPVANPKLQLFRGSTVIAENDDWGTATNSTEVANAALASGAFSLPTGSKDAGLLITVEPGGYSVHASGVGGATGAALLEVYEVP